MLLLESENPIPALVILGSTWILELWDQWWSKSSIWPAAVCHWGQGQDNSVLSSSHFKHLFVLFTHSVEIDAAEKVFFCTLGGLCKAVLNRTDPKNTFSKGILQKASSKIYSRFKGPKKSDDHFYRVETQIFLLTFGSYTRVLHFQQDFSARESRETHLGNVCLHWVGNFTETCLFDSETLRPSLPGGNFAFWLQTQLGLVTDPKTELCCVAGSAEHFWKAGPC